MPEVKNTFHNAIMRQLDGWMVIQKVIMINGIRSYIGVQWNQQQVHFLEENIHKGGQQACLRL